MRAADSKWPYRPVHITNYGEQSRDAGLQKLTGVGIISNEYLQGIQTRICANLENPTTIVEFSPSGEPVRTDSRLLYFAMHLPCRVFREYSYHKCCLGCDNSQALLFWRLTRGNVAENVNIRIRQSDHIQSYTQDAELHFRFAERKRPYLEYDCPLLGYRELLFPIFFEQQVVGTFFVGQLCLPARLSFISRKQNELFRLHPDFFREYMQNNPGISFDKIKEHILRAHTEWVCDLSHVLGETDYEDFIGRSCQALDQLEDTLLEQMELQRGTYVTQKIQSTIRRFRDNLANEPKDTKQKWTRLWTNVENQLSQIISDFSFRYFVVFAGGSKSSRASRLEVVARSRILPDELARLTKAGALAFNLDALPTGVRNQWLTSVEDPRIFDGLEGWSGYSRETNLVRIFPVPLFTQASMVVLVGYYDWNPVTSVEYTPGGQLSVAMQSLYTVVLSALSSILAASAEDKMETALRIFGHETGQLAAGLDWLRQLYLSDITALKQLSVEKSRDLCNDIQGYMSLLLFLSKQARMLLEIERPTKTYFLAYKEILFKWKDIYRLEADKKKLSLDILVPARDDPYRPRIWGDLALLEQTVYNLVNNAVKYCYRGTRISLDCAKEDLSPTSPHILTVTDYGMNIEGDADIYELYGRGANTAQIEGLGIGLFIVKKIAIAHGGDVEHECVKISDFNVPLIEPYLQSKLQWAKQPFMQRLDQELDRLRRSGDYYGVVALTDNGARRYSEPTRGELVNSISKSTWRVTFRVRIPPLEKQ